MKHAMNPPRAGDFSGVAPWSCGLCQRLPDHSLTKGRGSEEDHRKILHVDGKKKGVPGKPGTNSFQFFPNIIQLSNIIQHQHLRPQISGLTCRVFSRGYPWRRRTSDPRLR